MSKNERSYCKNIVLENAGIHLRPNYFGQVTDAQEQTIKTIPSLFKYFPQEKNKLIRILLVCLINPESIGFDKRVCDYAIEAIRDELWNIDKDAAQILLAGFIKLKRIYKDFIISERNNYIAERDDFWQLFLEKNEKHIEEFILNPLKRADFEYSDISSETLEDAFLLLPTESQDAEDELFLQQVIPIVIPELYRDKKSNDDRYGYYDYSRPCRFSNHFAHFMLNRSMTSLRKIMSEFVNELSDTEHVDVLISDFILAEDKINNPDNFWAIWNQLFPYIKHIITNHRNHKVSGIVHRYLLSGYDLNSKLRDWHTLKDNDVIPFFTNIVKELGHYSVILDAIARFLTNLGRKYQTQGLDWLYDLLITNSYTYKELGANTIYYLELYVQRFAITNGKEVKTKLQIKRKLLILLDFLVERNSVAGYLLREAVI